MRGSYLRLFVTDSPIQLLHTRVRRSCLFSQGSLTNINVFQANKIMIIKLQEFNEFTCVLNETTAPQYHPLSTPSGNNKSNSQGHNDFLLSMPSCFKMLIPEVSRRSSTISYMSDKVFPSKLAKRLTAS